MKHVHITGRLAHVCFSVSLGLSGVVKTWWRSPSPPTSALWLDVLLTLSPLIGRPLSVSEENTVQSFRMAPKIFHCGLRNWFCLWTLFVWGVSIKTTPKENKNSMMNCVIISHKKSLLFFNMFTKCRDSLVPLHWPSPWKPWYLLCSEVGPVFSEQDRRSLQMAPLYTSRLNDY